MSDRSCVSSNPLGRAPARGFFYGPFGRGLVLALVVTILPVFPILPGCGEEKGREDAIAGTGPRRLTGTTGLMAPGDEMFRSVEDGGTVPDAGTFRGSNDPSTGTGRWSLFLASVVGDDHPIQAAVLRNRIAAEYPQLRSAFVRPQGRGSAIWFGRFTGPTDPAAETAKALVDGLQRGGGPAFPRRMMVPLPDDSPIGERDIRNLRLMHPRIDPLYSLEVAMWWTGGLDVISYDEVRRQAEARVAELRRAGHDAWYYHDPIKEMSAVTIGVFDRRAYDGRSTLYSPEVDALMREFPVRQMNGEDVMIEVTPGDPRTRVPQACRLVVVPHLP